jgi:preprotein translocase subunit Sss1
MDLINVLLLIVGGILAISALIVAKKPDAKEWIDKLVPYQAIIGVALLAVGLVDFLSYIGAVLHLLKHAPVHAIVWLAVMVTSILLGFLFGMPQIAKWMPNQGAAEQKGLELSNKLAPFQVVIGLVGLGAALLLLLYRFGMMDG